MYTKEQVEDIIKRIINKDSIGDIHVEALKLAKELELNIRVGKREFERIKAEVIKEYGYTEEDLKEDGMTAMIDMETRAEFKYKYNFEYEE